FKRTLFYAVFISVISVVSGLVIAYYYDFAVSGTIVLINALIFLSLLVSDKAQTYFSVRK
ncbi:MAG: metal ABC transporter permease, partial [Candidatus Aenigmarchaeota archaeon]|nr:metal ABC transporter permease [Candidatus Aenigmarchaeota archaeon]